MSIMTIAWGILAVLAIIFTVVFFMDGDTGNGVKVLILAVVFILAFCLHLGIDKMQGEQEQTTTEQTTTEQIAEQAQWSDWQEAEDSFLLQEVEEDTYVVEQDDGTYVCKALKYSSTGETEETYKVIEKNDDITVKFLDLMEGEKPYGEVLERTSNDETQTMYVFHVPATEN